MFALLGPNGAGKSTTFNIITTLVKPSKGKVMLKGQKVNRGISSIFYYDFFVWDLWALFL